MPAGLSAQLRTRLGNKLHSVFLLDGYPSGRGLWVTLHKLVHVGFRYSVNVHAIPVTGHHKRDITSVMVLSATIRLTAARGGQR